MILIKKGKEPKELIEYRTNKWNPYEKQSVEPSFEDMPTEIKDAIRRELLKEQGYLCAYCMRRIKSVEETKIEHWVPQEKLTKEQGLDYSNMLGVCYGRVENQKIDSKKSSHFTSGKEVETCDQHKGSKELVVDPRATECVRKIKYHSKNGRIYSDDPKINRDLDVTLNLNCEEPHLLPQNRKAKLEEVIIFLNKKYKTVMWRKQDLIKLREKYAKKNNEGMIEEYAGIILWFIDSRLGRM